MYTIGLLKLVKWTELKVRAEYLKKNEVLGWLPGRWNLLLCVWIMNEFGLEKFTSGAHPEWKRKYTAPGQGMWPKSQEWILSSQTEVVQHRSKYLRHEKSSGPWTKTRYCIKHRKVENLQFKKSVPVLKASNSTPVPDPN